MKIFLKKRVASPTSKELAASPLPPINGQVGTTTLHEGEVNGPDGAAIFEALATPPHLPNPEVRDVSGLTL